MSDYAHPESLASTTWLAEHLDDPSVRIVEVDWGMSNYRSGHIPGAVGWDWPSEVQNPVQRDLLDQSEFEALLSRSGITADSTVVVCSSLNNLLATYAFWLFKIYGHADVRLLDGDREKWLAEGRPTTTDAPVVSETTYHSQAPDWSLRADRDWVARSLNGGLTLLVDLRPVDMYSGENSYGAERAGHIPGAVNLPARREAGPDGSFKAWRVPTVKADATFKSAEELRSLVQSLGIQPEREVITYCVRAGLSSHAWFVLTQLLGYGNVREYDGSWAEWGSLMGAPIEK